LTRMLSLRNYNALPKLGCAIENGGARYVQKLRWR